MQLQPPQLPQLPTPSPSMSGIVLVRNSRIKPKEIVNETHLKCCNDNNNDNNNNNGNGN